MNIHNFDPVFSYTKDLMVQFGVKLIIAIGIIYAGFFVSSLISKLTKKIMHSSKIDKGVVGFVGSLISVSIKIAVLLTAASTIGINTSAFLAVLGGAGLAIGLALQGSLQNFAGGFLILLFKPFSVGDFIELENGYSGTVHQIRTMTTTLKTIDNKTIIIPNAQLSNNTLINYSVEKNRRADMLFSIHPQENLEKVKNLMMETLQKDIRLVKPPEIIISALNPYSVDMQARCWIDKEDFILVQSDFQVIIKQTLIKNNIRLPEIASQIIK